jgi:hypothetical protein
LERRQFGLQGIISAITKSAPEAASGFRALRSVIKNEAKEGLHQAKDNKGKGKVYSMILPASFVTRDLESQELASRELEMRQFGLQGIINAVTKSAPEAASGSRALESIIKNEAKEGLHQVKDNKKSKTLHAALGGFVTRNLESPYEIMEREYDDGAMSYA